MMTMAQDDADGAIDAAKDCRSVETGRALAAELLQNGVVIQIGHHRFGRF